MLAPNDSRIETTAAEPSAGRPPPRPHQDENHSVAPRTDETSGAQPESFLTALLRAYAPWVT